MPFAAFRIAFGDPPPRWLVRAPGRVNLIGEHIDYDDLPVFPMAIQRETRLVLRARDDDRVRVANLDRHFGPREFRLTERIDPFAQGDWGNYPKAAAQVLVTECGVRRGFDAVIEGSVPAAAGLSSSSSLVVACGLALATVNELALPPLDFAARMARGERYVGTNSGGMDQAVCVAGRASHALRIDFAPLRTQAVPLPQGWRFVIAHSLVHADKAGSARDAYNARRSECERALARVSAEVEQGETPWRYPTLRAAYEIDHLLSIATRVLDDVALRRFRHSLREAARVDAAEDAMRAGNADAFGALMNESHESLARDYDVSHPALDALVGVARAHGALGARLTGAGFGGCIVALVHARDAEALADGIRRDFHASRPALAGLPEPVLIATASDGASARELAGFESSRAER